MGLSRQEYLEKLGTKIRTIRVQNRESQSTLAKLIDCSQAHISDIESGIRDIHTYNLALIASHYKVSLSYFFDGMKLEPEENKISKTRDFTDFIQSRNA